MKEKIAKGGVRRLFEEGDYFKYFGQRSGAIIPGRRLIEGRLVFEEIQHFRRNCGLQFSLMSVGL